MLSSIVLWVIQLIVFCKSCSNMADCSYNGICNTTTNICSCLDQWKGTHCAELNIIAGSKHAGLRLVDNGSRNSTWGGAVVKDPQTGIYHMVASEITYHCGIRMWLSNSIIIHATTHDLFNEPFKKIDTVQGIFSHEPDMIQALDTGEFVVYFSNEYPPKTNGQIPCTDCTNGVTSNYCKTNREYQSNVTMPCPTKMKYSSSTWSNWSSMNVIPMMEPQPLRPADSNLACYIFPNGSLVGIGRYANANRTDDDLRGFYLTKATNWKDNNTYSNFDITYKFPQDPGEDPAIWYDKKYDVLHAIWHYNNQTNWGQPMGLHTFSTDGGFNWMAYYGEYAYQSYTQFIDAPPINFTQCERPHLVFNDDGAPIALTNAVVPPQPDNGDYSYTLLRPIKQQI